MEYNIKHRTVHRDITPSEYTTDRITTDGIKNEELIMKLQNLTFIVTDDCNFNCEYCFQKKDKKTITKQILEKAVDFFYPYLTGDGKANISFYGGEPLLAYEHIRHITELILIKEEEHQRNKGQTKGVGYTITTNGSLLTDEIMEYFNRRRFYVILSYDGIAQDEERKKGTTGKMKELMVRLCRQPGITTEINSVFTPKTAGMMADSIRYIIQSGGPEVTLNFSNTDTWEPQHLEEAKRQLDVLTDFLIEYYREHERIPVKNFQPRAQTQKGFECSAGKTQMAITPEGRVWGCFLFHDFFKTKPDNPQYNDYDYGTLQDFVEEFEKRYPEITANYAELKQSYFQVEGEFCFLCDDLKSCMVCPINAAYNTGELGKISCHHCRLMKLQAAARNQFQTRLEQAFGR
jgi:sulfatase maturation enzyme AslB (radical SAM superfamily)